VATSDPIEAARALALSSTQSAARTEREGTLPRPLVDELAAAGLFRLCLPRELDGPEVGPRVLVEVFATLARGDGAAGWCTMIGATSGLVAGSLPREAAAAIYGDPLVISGGVYAPLGRAEPADGGYRVSGRWPFASGCRHCDWLMGGCLVDGAVPRLALVPAGSARIIENWEVAGLRGTGSHDIAIDDVHVPAAHTASLLADRPWPAGVLYRLPIFGMLAVGIAAVALGIGQGAIDDLIADPGRPSSRVQAAVARAQAQLAAARALLELELDRAFEQASAGGEVEPARRAALRLAASHAAHTAAEVARAMFELAGASAIHERHPLQRRFRDAHVATHHVMVAPATFPVVGRVLMGLDVAGGEL
jgi:alkylation response protein AidB-like acyl-CoA dehydrogenase